MATHRNRSAAHGKEGVDGSSPSEGLQNPRSRGFSVQDDLLFVVRAVDMELFMELSRTRHWPGAANRSPKRPDLAPRAFTHTAESASACRPAA